MRCPTCGARNSEDATFCTQCYANVATPDTLDAPAEVDVPPPHSAATTAPAASAPGVHAASARDVRERDGVVEWRCAACDGWSGLEAAACVVCGTARRGFGEDAGTRPSRELGTGIVGASLLVPGLGHVLAGRSGSGLARAILWVLWLLGGLVVVVTNAGTRALPGWLLLASALVLWGATAIDAQRLVAGDRRELLGTRALGLLVMVVTLGLVLSVAVVLLTGS